MTRFKDTNKNIIIGAATGYQKYPYPNRTIKKETIIIISTHENSLDEHFDKIISLN